VRLYPREHTYSLDDWQCGELFGALAERRTVVLLDLAETTWSDVEHVCRTYPGLSLVVMGAGYRQLRLLFALLERCDNLFCDLSNLCTYLGVEEILDRFDSGRMLFGTGLPAADPGGPIARLYYTDAPQADIAAMAHDPSAEVRHVVVQALGEIATAGIAEEAPADSAGIDPIAVYEIKKIVGDLSRKGIGVLITDHNVRDTLEITNRSYIINLGEILVSGTKEELLTNEIARKVYLGENFSM